MFKYTIAKSYPLPKPPTFYDPSLNGVGIDLGTTRSCTAVNKNNTIDVIAVDNSDRPLPSFIGYEEDVPRCGSIVARRMPNFSQHAVFDVKRIIGKSYESVVIDPFWPFKVIKDGQNVKVQTMDSKKSPILLNPEEISAVLLRHMKKKAEEIKGTVLKEAVLTVPVAFNQNQIDATLEAAALAGWETIHILPEPIAACFTYASENEIPKNSNVLLFDLGGGTLDICIVRIENEELKILKSFGDLYLGGRNFDTLLMNHFNIILRKSHNIDIRERPFRKYKLLLKCQELKHDLEAVSEVMLDVADFDPDSDANIPITRREFKDLSDEILVRLNAKIIEALENLNLTRHDINYVLQVGGGCRMLMITPEEVAAELFKHIKYKAECYDQLWRQINNVVITVPVDFTETQKNATTFAAKLACFDEVVFLPEEIAATFAYFINRPIPHNSTTLLFNLGGKTLNICVLKIKHGTIKIISNTNDQNFGGRNFDVLLFNHFKNLLKTKFYYDIKGPIKKYRLMSECQRIKEDLSFVASSTLDVEDFDPSRGGTISINHKDFETMCKPLLKKIEYNTCLAYGAASNDTLIDKVVYAGGGSRMPMIRNLLTEIFPTSEHCCEVNPDEVVAIGAAYFARSIFKE